MKTDRLDTLTPLLARDLELDYALGGGFFEDADLGVGTRAGAAPKSDLTLAGGLDNMTQAIANRLKTRLGELASLGHPDYGSRHHELIGEPNVPRTWNLIKLYILQALRGEPRIAKVVAATVGPEHQPPRDTVRIELTVLLLGLATPVDLVVPFSLEVAL
jgi:phage baseplate assembly protein W